MTQPTDEQFAAAWREIHGLEKSTPYHTRQGRDMYAALLKHCPELFAPAKPQALTLRQEVTLRVLACDLIGARTTEYAAMMADEILSLGDLK